MLSMHECMHDSEHSSGKLDFLISLHWIPLLEEELIRNGQLIRMHRQSAVPAMEAGPML